MQPCKSSPFLLPKSAIGLSGGTLCVAVRRTVLSTHIMHPRYSLPHGVGLRSLPMCTAQPGVPSSDSFKVAVDRNNKDGVSHQKQLKTWLRRECHLLLKSGCQNSQKESANIGPQDAACACCAFEFAACCTHTRASVASRTIELRHR